jgi:hypothetical protein
MREVLAFADESGQPNLNTSLGEVSTHYIISAVMVGADDLERCRSRVEAIRAKRFQKGAIRSQKVGDNDERRLKILTDLGSVGLHGLALIVDKDLIREDGPLRFQRSFRSFLNRKLYDELFGTFPTLELVADRVGKSDFMRNFKKYLDKRHFLDTLFNSSAMHWGAAKDDVLLQVADFVSGSFGRCFDRKKGSPMAQQILQLLVPWVQLREWPWQKPLQTAGVSDSDHVVRRVAHQRAQEFVGSHQKTRDEDRRNQVQCLKYLLFHSRHVDADSYVHAPEIISSIQIPRMMNVRQFQTRVIAKLRDAGVLIASNAKGYKLPSRLDDVREYLRWTNMQVEPMIRRARRMDEAIRLGSNNKLALLDEDEFKYLRGPALLENACLG